MNIDLSELAAALIGLCATVIAGFTIPCLRKKLTAGQFEAMRQLAAVAVQAAESIYGSGQGQEKKAYVQQYLAAKSVRLDDAVIEASVYELLNSSGGNKALKVKEDCNG